MNPLILLSDVLLVLGGFFCLTGGVGLWKMKNFFTRVHGAAVLDSLGAILILVGLMLRSGEFSASLKEESLLSIKIGITLVFLLLTGPAAVYALCKAALGSGIDPLADDPEKKER